MVNIGGFNVEREKNRAYSFGRSRGWPDIMRTPVPKTWNSETVKQYKILYKKYKK